MTRTIMLCVYLVRRINLWLRFNNGFQITEEQKYPPRTSHLPCHPLHLCSCRQREHCKDDWLPWLSETHHTSIDGVSLMQANQHHLLSLHHGQLPSKTVDFHCQKIILLFEYVLMILWAFQVQGLPCNGKLHVGSILACPSTNF